MKKFFAIILVLAMVMLILVSCAESNPEITKNTYDIELTYEDVIIDGFKAGKTANYGDYYHFSAHSNKGYLVFLDTMSDEIEIINIDIYYESGYGTQYKITYKLPNN